MWTQVGVSRCFALIWVASSVVSEVAKVGNRIHWPSWPLWRWAVGAVCLAAWCNRTSYGRSAGSAPFRWPTPGPHSFVNWNMRHIQYRDLTMYPDVFWYPDYIKRVWFFSHFYLNGLEEKTGGFIFCMLFDVHVRTSNLTMDYYFIPPCPVLYQCT